jgi:hypothetical protein
MEQVALIAVAKTKPELGLDRDAVGVRSPRRGVIEFRRMRALILMATVLGALAGANAAKADLSATPLGGVGIYRYSDCS